MMGAGIAQWYTSDWTLRIVLMFIPVVCLCIVHFAGIIVIRFKNRTLSGGVAYYEGAIQYLEPNAVPSLYSDTTDTPPESLSYSVSVPNYSQSQQAAVQT
jgi:hypothetical protein